MKIPVTPEMNKVKFQLRNDSFYKLMYGKK